MNVLVTGGCGYVGTVLTTQLLQRGHNVTVVDAGWFGNFLPAHENLTIIQEDTRNTDKLPIKQAEVIFHLANIANDPCVELDPKLSWEVNALATMQLMDRAARQGVKQFIFASSGSVYGVKEEPRVTEDLELKPISEYNKTKMVAERVLLSYQDKMIIQCIRPATVCGYSPRMRLDLSVNMLAFQALSRGKITVFGGDQVRPNIHIDDMAAVYLHMLDLKDRATGIYNAGFENISILDIAKMVTALVPAEIVITPSNDPRSYRMNSDKLLATGFKPKKNVETAIKEIITAYKNKSIVDNENCYNVKWMKKTVFK